MGLPGWTKQRVKRMFALMFFIPVNHLAIESEYDQEIPQSQATDNPVAPRGRAAQPS